jgi:hypothetical protein
MLARLYRPDTSQGMPMVWRGKADRLDLFIIEDLAHVAVTFHRASGELLILTGTLLQNMFIYIAESNYLDSRLVVEANNVLFALPMDSHHSHAHFIVGCEHLARARQGYDSRNPTQRM